MTPAEAVDSCAISFSGKAHVYIDEPLRDQHPKTSTTLRGDVHLRPVPCCLTVTASRANEIDRGGRWCGRRVVYRPGIFCPDDECSALSGTPTTLVEAADTCTGSSGGEADGYIGEPHGCAVTKWVQRHYICRSNTSNAIGDVCRYLSARYVVVPSPTDMGWVPVQEKCVHSLYVQICCHAHVPDEVFDVSDKSTIPCTHMCVCTSKWWLSNHHTIEKFTHDRRTLWACVDLWWSMHSYMTTDSYSDPHSSCHITSLPPVLSTPYSHTSHKSTHRPSRPRPDGRRV